MSKDILLFESGDGGEMEVANNDITLTETLFQQVYLRLFGGNLEASTTGTEIEGQEREDWWGNSLLFEDEKEKQFNSTTEQILDRVALNTSGRIDIIRAVEFDLKGLEGIADVSVDVVILSESRIKISVLLQKPGKIEDKFFQFIWDNARKEVIIDKRI